MKSEDAVNTIAEVNLGTLRSNVDVARSLARGCPLIAVVKADAYGHGAVPITKTLVDEGIQDFAVATVAEGIELRQAGIGNDILVLAGPLPDHFPWYVANKLEITISSLESAEQAAAFATVSGAKLTAHLKIDTGMNRLGVHPEEFSQALKILDHPGIDLKAVWTHLADSEDAFSSYSIDQLRHFEKCLAEVEQTVVTHLPFSHYRSALDQFRFPRLAFRVGIDLYSATNKPDVAVQTILNAKSRVVHLHEIAAGECVSYRMTWKAPAPTIIATVGAGYADGYPRTIRDHAYVSIHGRHYPIRGVVCMDMLMVDLGPDGRDHVRVGDTVTLFGSTGPEPAEVAEWANTIVYSITCGVGKRVPRVYIDS